MGAGALEICSEAVFWKAGSQSMLFVITATCVPPAPRERNRFVTAVSGADASVGVTASRPKLSTSLRQLADERHRRSGHHHEERASLQAFLSACRAHQRSERLARNRWPSTACPRSPDDSHASTASPWWA